MRKRFSNLCYIIIGIICCLNHFIFAQTTRDGKGISHFFKKLVDSFCPKLEGPVYCTTTKDYCITSEVIQDEDPERLRIRIGAFTEG